MIEVIVWVTRAVGAAAAVVPDPDRAVVPEPVRLPPPRVAAGAVVSGGAAVVVVGSSHGTVDVVEVVDGSVAAGAVVEVVEVEVVEEVEEVVVDESGADVFGAESTGAVDEVVVVGAGGGAGAVGVVQSSNAALEAAGTDEAALPVEPVARGVVLAVLEGTALELV